MYQITVNFKNGRRKVIEVDWFSLNSPEDKKETVLIWQHGTLSWQTDEIENVEILDLSKIHEN